MPLVEHGRSEEIWEHVRGLALAIRSNPPGRLTRQQECALDLLIEDELDDDQLEQLRQTHTEMLNDPNRCSAFDAA